MNGLQVEEAQNVEIPISAVILDLDGTLLNTEQVTNGVLAELLAKYGKVVDREKEDERLGMTHKEAAIAIIKDYDLPLTHESYTQEIFSMCRERWTEAKALPGANQLILHLHKHEVPFALASNALRKNIDEKISHQQGWRELFSVILGSDQVKSGKPAPDLFLEAAHRMGVDAAHCLVIEDSLIGVQAAKAAGMMVVAVPSLTKADQYSIADCVLPSLLEFQPELWGLPPFQDYINNALPIDPLHLKGLYSNGLLYQSPDSKPSALPDQVSGLFFGWAKDESHEIFKTVTNIGWHHGCCSSKRKIHVCLISESDESICDQQIELLLVGYITGLSNQENISADVEVPEEGISVARVSLDLPIFSKHKNDPFFSEEAFLEDFPA